MNKIKIKDKEYPCRFTMGAALDFKRETDKDITHLSQPELTDIVTLMWCCVRSACRIDKVDFDMSLEEFADSIDVSDVLAWQEANAERRQDAVATNGAKKK